MRPSVATPRTRLVSRVKADFTQPRVVRVLRTRCLVLFPKESFRVMADTDIPRQTLDETLERIGPGLQREGERLSLRGQIRRVILGMDREM